MAKKNNLIPFRWLPASWGLVGQPFEEAKAFYELDGEDLERRLIEVRFKKGSVEYCLEHLKLDLATGVLDDFSYEIAEATLLGETDEIDPKTKLDIEKRHGKVAPYEYSLKLAEIAFPDKESIEYQIAALTADYEHGKIEALEYEKTLATAKNEPWVGIVDNGFNTEEGLNGLYFELDWNDQWVSFLKKNGYHGQSDDQIVEQWFSDVCRSQAEENPVDDNQPIPFNSGRVINRIRRDGGTEYS